MKNTFKALNITATNAKKIEVALAAVNGRAAAHTFTTFAEIEQVATTLERKLRSLGIAKKYRSGARGTARSGHSVAKSYDYARKATDVCLERRSSTWFLASIDEATAYAEDAHPRVTLTESQDAIAIANLRSAYSIKRTPALTEKSATESPPPAAMGISETTKY
jgi:hypothetical protein